MRIRKIDNTTVYYILLLLIWLPPSVITNLFQPYVSYLFIVARTAVGLWYLRRKGFRIDKKPVIICMLLFLFCGFVGMLARAVVDIFDIGNYACYIISLLGIYTFFKVESYNKIYKFFTAVKILCFFSLVMTFLIGTTISADAEYGSQVYFWGSKAVTTQVFTMLLALTIFAEKMFHQKIKSSTWICYAFSMLFAIINNSGQGVSMMGLFGLLLFVNKVWNDKLWKMISPIPFVLIIAFLNYIVITMRFKDFAFITNYITQILSKDLSLSGRDQIFEGTLSLFWQKPLFGYGFGNSVIYDTLGKIWKAFNTAHNSILQIMIDYGAIGTSMFALMVFFGLKTMKKSENRAVEVLYLAMFVMFVGGLVNMIVPTYYFWIVFITAIAIPGNLNMKTEEKEYY